MQQSRRQRRSGNFCVPQMCNYRSSLLPYPVASHNTAPTHSKSVENSPFPLALLTFAWQTDEVVWTEMVMAMELAVSSNALVSNTHLTHANATCRRQMPFKAFHCGNATKPSTEFIQMSGKCRDFKFRLQLQLRQRCGLARSNPAAVCRGVYFGQLICG